MPKPASANPSPATKSGFVAAEEEGIRLFFFAEISWGGNCEG